MRNKRSELITSDKITRENESLSTSEFMIKKFKLLMPSPNIQMLTLHRHALICTGRVEVSGLITFSYTILHILNNDIPIFTILYGTHTSTDADL